jgi:hypothetical protein
VVQYTLAGRHRRRITRHCDDFSSHCAVCRIFLVVNTNLQSLSTSMTIVSDISPSVSLKAINDHYTTIPSPTQLLSSMNANRRAGSICILAKYSSYHMQQETPVDVLCIAHQHPMQTLLRKIITPSNHQESQPDDYSSIPKARKPPTTRLVVGQVRLRGVVARVRARA